MSDFDPEGTFTKDSSIFGFPKDMPSNLLILPLAWEVTTSFRRGTSKGPSAIFDASKQMDLYHPYWKRVYTKGVSWAESILDLTKKLNNEASESALNIIDSIENGKEASESEVEKVNLYSKKFNDLVYRLSNEAEKKVGIVGGDHSCPYGLIKSLSERYKGEFSIVHIDAHFDLRIAYQGFTHSHASIMKNILDLENSPQIYQMGLRDFSESELKIAEESTYFLLDHEFQNLKLSGKSFESILDVLFKDLSKKIYISFDIDGLTPEFCPNTGTPVPGGINYSEASYLIQYLHRKGHELIGFDLVEVSPKSDLKLGLDEIIASRLLYELCCFSLSS